MGERDHFISMEMAAIGMEMMARMGLAGDRRAARDAHRAARRRLARHGRRRCRDARVRAPHILSLGFPKGMPQGLVQRLAAENVYVAPRLGRLRISPHVYNDEADVDRFVAVFSRLIA